MKWRGWIANHWRGFQATTVLLALALAVLVTARIERRRTPAIVLEQHPDALEKFHAEMSAIPTTWDIRKGPDGATFTLTTKCVNDVLYYRFEVWLTPKITARYHRTFGTAPRFEVALLDSAGFKASKIPISSDLLAQADDSTGHPSYLTANDQAPLTCVEYRQLSSWDPTWRLAP